jgi:hypothetical protein
MAAVSASPLGSIAVLSTLMAPPPGASVASSLTL